MSEQTPCPICDKPIPDTAYVCPACADELCNRLVALATLWPDVIDAAHRLNRVERPSVGTASAKEPTPPTQGPDCGRSECAHESCMTIAWEWVKAQRQPDEMPIPNETVLPFSPEISEDRDAIANTVTTWARDVLDSTGMALPSSQLEPTAAGAMVIAARVTWLAHQRFAEEAFDELTHAYWTAINAVDTARSRIYVGPCDLCRKDMYAKAGATVVVCRPCDVQYAISARRDWLTKQAEDVFATATEAARALRDWGHDVTPERIRQWAARGRIKATPDHHTGKPMYRVGDVIVLLDNLPTKRVALRA